MRFVLHSETGQQDVETNEDVETNGATEEIPAQPHQMEVNEKQSGMSQRSSEVPVDTTLDRSAWHREVTINRLEGMSFNQKKMVRVSGILTSLLDV